MRFEKVSKEIYDNIIINYKHNSSIKPLSKIVLPQRATPFSAGYDIYSPFDFSLHPGMSIKIPTFLRIKLDPDKFLMIVPRSGIGFKTGVRLSNTVGIIDADYYNSDNGGHIWVKLDYPKLNDVDLQQTLSIKEGEAICQGIIMQYFKVENDVPKYNVRNGGLGSTNK